MTPKPSKFDVKPACEEIAPEFVPTHNDLVDSVPPEMLEASYRKTEGEKLFGFFVNLQSSLNRIALDRSEAEVRGDAYLMTV